MPDARPGPVFIVGTVGQLDRGSSSRGRDQRLSRLSQRQDDPIIYDLCMSGAPLSPRIVAIEWGQTEVEGLGVYKDVKLWPGGGREWDWNETGTRHVPGTLPGDVQELMDHGAEVVVLSRGMQLRLHTSPETLDLLRRQSIEVHIAETNDAVELYNRLAVSRPVGCVIHSTC